MFYLLHKYNNNNKYMFDNIFQQKCLDRKNNSVQHCTARTAVYNSVQPCTALTAVYTITFFQDSVAGVCTTSIVYPSPRNKIKIRTFLRTCRPANVDGKVSVYYNHEPTANKHIFYIQVRNCCSFMTSLNQLCIFIA